MENNRCMIKVRARKIQQKDRKIERFDGEEGFGLFQDENYEEENFFDDFKRLRIDDSEELSEESENFSKKQRSGENDVFEFQTLESVKKQEILSQNEKQQNLLNEIDVGDFDTVPSISESYLYQSDKDSFQIDEIDYIKELYGNQKQQIEKRNKKTEKKNQEKKKVQILLRHQIRRY